MNGHRGNPASASLAIFLFLSISLVLVQGVTAATSDRMQADQLVEKARLTLHSFRCDETMSAFRDLLRDAKGVMIFPSLLKAAFIVGASGGNGVFLVRDKANEWAGPAFYTLGGGSFGLQIGGQSSEVILVAMTDRGVASFLSNSFKLGADAGLAVGPVGIGASAATANLSADILSFSRSKGLYGGISLDGAVVAVRGGLNDAYFGGNPTPADILVKQSVRSPHSIALVGYVAKAASEPVTSGECEVGVRAGSAK